MADEFVEVVNTTITSTQLPSNNSTHTLKTAGANESFALKDIGIKTQSTVAEYSFLLNDFEALSFSAGESGVASGLDLIPKSGTLKIKGKNIPIDSESVLISVENYVGSGAQSVANKELVLSPEFSRPDQSLNNFNSSYTTSETYASPYTSVGSWNNYYSHVWTDGDRFRGIRLPQGHTSQGRFEYADTAGGSASYINAYSIEYVPDLNQIYYIDTSTGNIKRSSTNSNISFSNWKNPSSTSSLDRIIYSKGWIWWINSLHDSNPTIKAFHTTTNIELTFSGSGKAYQGNQSTNTSMGWALNYDPATDKFYFFRSSYQTSNPQYISRHEVPKTLTEMNAYSSNTTISDTFANSYKSFNRTSASNGPFSYNYPHMFRGSSINGNVFYCGDHTGSNRYIYTYDFDSNSLTNTELYLGAIGGNTTAPLIQQREINTADETQYGGSFSNVDVRVTGIKTT